MTLSKSQLDNFFAATLLLSFAIALTLSLLIIQMSSQVHNTLDNLVHASLKPTLALPQTEIPIGLIRGNNPADDILVEWKTKYVDTKTKMIDTPNQIVKATDNQIVVDNDAQIMPTEIINFPETIAVSDLDLTDFSLRDLKDLAKLRGIPGYSRMSKAKLLTALS